MKRFLPVFFSVILVGLMTAAAEFLGESEIIFPEIAAIAVGALIVPKFSWNTSKLRILIYICICAVLGVAIVKYLPLPIWAQMTAAFILAQILLVNSKTSFAPMISAAVLPVMLQTKTPVYLISASVLTALIILCRIILEKIKFVDKNDFSPLPKPNLTVYKNLILRTILGCAIIIPALAFDFKFAVAPPLLVAFTEFSNPQSKARNKPFKAVALIFLCGFLGAAIRYILCIRLKILPLFAASILIILCVIALMKAFKMYIPPAGAIGILSLLIPENAVIWFPIQILAGTSVIMLFSMLFFKEMKSER